MKSNSAARMGNLALVAAALCFAGCGGMPGDTAADDGLASTQAAVKADGSAVMDEVLANESFQATVQMLQQRGVEVNLSAKAATYEQAATGFTLSFPLKGESYLQLIYDATDRSAARVIVAESVKKEEAGVGLMGTCGSYIYANTCNYGPFYSGAGCSSGPLYQYGNYTRRIYTGGRNTSVNYWWYDCRWMAQDSTCTSTCSP